MSIPNFSMAKVCLLRKASMRASFCANNSGDNGGPTLHTLAMHLPPLNKTEIDFGINPTLNRKKAYPVQHEKGRVDQGVRPLRTPPVDLGLFPIKQRDK